jgi:hypothetical protein
LLAASLRAAAPIFEAQCNQAESVAEMTSKIQGGMAYPFALRQGRLSDDYTKWDDKIAQLAGQTASV